MFLKEGLFRVSGQAADIIKRNIMSAGESGKGDLQVQQMVLKYHGAGICQRHSVDLFI